MGFFNVQPSIYNDSLAGYTHDVMDEMERRRIQDLKADKSLSGRIIEGNYLYKMLCAGKMSFTDEEHKQYIKSVDKAMKECGYWVHNNYDLDELIEDYPYLIRKNNDDSSTSYELVLIDEDMEKTIEVCSQYFRVGLTIDICILLEKAFQNGEIKKILKPKKNCSGMNEVPENNRN